MSDEINSKSKGPGSIYVSPVDRAHGMTDYSDKFDLAMRFIEGRRLPKKDVNLISKHVLPLVRKESIGHNNTES